MFSLVAADSIDTSSSPSKKRDWIAWFRPSRLNPAHKINEAAQSIAGDVATITANFAPVLVDVGNLLAPAVGQGVSEPVTLAEVTGNSDDVHV